MTTFFIRCFDANPKHVKFAVFDLHGANCGSLCIRTPDLKDFLLTWKGDIQWQGHDPFQWLP